MLLVGLFLVFNQPWPSSWCWAAANPLWSSPILPCEGQAPSWVWGTPTPLPSGLPSCVFLDGAGASHCAQSSSVSRWDGLDSTGTS